MSPTRVIARRVGAFAIDFVLTGAFYWGLFLLMAERRTAVPRSSVKATFTLNDTVYAITGGKAALFFLLFALAGLAYWAALPGLTGFTLGKAALGLRVVRPDGTVPAGVGRNLARQVVGIVDYFPWFVPGLVGLIVALASRGNRRVGDMAADTNVVAKEAAGRPVMEPGGEAQAPAEGGRDSS
jgi:uncharacterized RDD family membrane protein YckC